MHPSIKKHILFQPKFFKHNFQEEQGDLFRFSRISSLNSSLYYIEALKQAFRVKMFWIVRQSFIYQTRCSVHHNSPLFVYLNSFFDMAIRITRNLCEAARNLNLNLNTLYANLTVFSSDMLTLNTYSTTTGCAECTHIMHKQVTCIIIKNDTSEFTTYITCTINFYQRVTRCVCTVRRVINWAMFLCQTLTRRRLVTNKCDKLIEPFIKAA